VNALPPDWQQGAVLSADLERFTSASNLCGEVTMCVRKVQIEMDKNSNPDYSAADLDVAEQERQRQVLLATGNRHERRKAAAKTRHARRLKSRRRH